MQGRGSVLYIAAHPDDENTRLLSYLSSEKLYRTGYLSITRGDGGQNLIGGEQGAELGMIRTRELMAARNIDGAEQFFTRAADFGYSKSPDEALRIWGHNEVLSDVVYVIRKFRPDVIITRFPTTGEGGHGHHTASAILAGEAFDAAGDPLRFPEHFNLGVGPWKPSRLLWNTFNFGNNNTQKESQFKIDVGLFNPVLGRGYGEIAAESRSQHRSQGFGVPAQRGQQFEFFETIKGDAPRKDLVENQSTDPAVEMARKISSDFDPNNPAKSIASLQQLKKTASGMKTRPAQLSDEKLDEIILAAAGIYAEATTNTQLLTKGDSVRVSFLLNSRSVQMNSSRISFLQFDTILNNIPANTSATFTKTFPVKKEYSTEPYWLERSYSRTMTGDPWNSDLPVTIVFNLNGVEHKATRNIVYRYTDPVRGELYQPVHIVPAITVSNDREVLVIRDNEPKTVNYTLRAMKEISGRLQFFTRFNGSSTKVLDSVVAMEKGSELTIPVALSKKLINGSETLLVRGEALFNSESYDHTLKQIRYEHIPDISYTYLNQLRVINADIKTAGRRAGYIEGAGDRVREALEQLGYEVSVLEKKDLTAKKLSELDVVVTGIRAYNIHTWLSNAFPLLMEFVNNGGTLVVQYNTNNSIGPVRSRIFPYNFNITRKRITNENSPVTLARNGSRVLDHPNRITEKDFEGWVQERSIYHAEAAEPFGFPLIMNDPGEPGEKGALIVADHGRGRIVYTGISFFRQLPAGVTGAYRLFANIISKR